MRNGQKPDVLVVGAYYADLVFSGVPEMPGPGGEVFATRFDLVPGGAFTPAMALHRLGCDVVWATAFGSDLFSREVLRAARREGLNEAGFTVVDRHLRSVTAVVSGVDRSMVSFQDPPVNQDLVGLVEEFRPRVLMLPILRHGAEVVRALAHARARGTTVFMDCQDVPVDLEQARAALAEVDVFAPNETEALRLTGADTVERAALELAGTVATVVVKRGADGALAAQGDRLCRISAPKVAAIDTTGAGDCFDAGFLHGLLTGADLRGCVAAGVACGTASVTGPGSTAAPAVGQLAELLLRVLSE
jgi:sugar/nucleoside kinase (ribokinase family)